MITFEQFTERVYKGLKADLTKGKKKVTEEELRKLIKTKNKNKELENLDVSEITDMSCLFEATDYGKWVISDIDDWDTSNVTTMRDMFFNCSSLTKAPEFNDTSNVIDMHGMFYGCSSLTEAPKFNTSKVENMEMMFESCRKLKEAPKFDTSNVTDMRGMFYDCKSLKEAPEFKDTSKVTSMFRMFYGCSSLTNGDMSNWDISKVKNHNEMFLECDKFPEDKKPKFKD